MRPSQTQDPTEFNGEDSGLEGSKRTMMGPIGHSFRNSLLTPGPPCCSGRSLRAIPLVGRPRVCLGPRLGAGHSSAASASWRRGPRIARASPGAAVVGSSPRAPRSRAAGPAGSTKPSRRTDVYGRQEAVTQNPRVDGPPPLPRGHNPLRLWTLHCHRSPESVQIVQFRHASWNSFLRRRIMAK